MNWIEANNGATRYTLSGSSPDVVVLIHEMGGSIESWDALLPLVEPGRTVLRYDMRGFGDATKVSGTHSIDTLTGDLAALLDALSIAVPVDVCGMAVGGAAALHFAAKYPERARRIALMSPALGVDPARRADVGKRADSIEANGMGFIGDSELGLTYPVALRDENFPAYRARWLGNDPASYAATYRMLVGLDSGHAMAAVRAPTLVLAGALDPLRPPELMSQVAAGVSGARLQIVPGGHVMAHQTPDAVSEQLHAFWQTE